MKSITSILFCMLISTVALADTWGITGALLVKPANQAPATIPVDNRSIFLSELECETARKAGVMLDVRSAYTNSSGALPAYNTWLPQANVVVTDFTMCVKTSQY